MVPLGYDLDDRRLVVNPEEAKKVNQIFRAYLKQGCVSRLQIYLEEQGIRSKKRISKTGNITGDNVFSRGALYLMLQNRVYLGEITHKDQSYPGQQPAIIDQDLWDKVQAQLKANMPSEIRRAPSSNKNLLVGLLYDADGNRFTPSYANKKGRRYRYYVSQALFKFGKKQPTGPTRLPAEEIEELVVAQLCDLLRSPQRLLEILGECAAKPEDSKRVLIAAAELASRAETAVTSAVQRVTVHPGRIEIEIAGMQLLRALGVEVDDWTDTSTEPIIIEVTASFKRQGGEVRLQLPPHGQGAKSRPVPSLIKAVARAHEWADRARKGETDNVRMIAAETGFDERYVSRLLPLAYLAPDLIEAILDGRHDATLGESVGNIPLDWASQRNALAGV